MAREVVTVTAWEAKADDLPEDVDHGHALRGAVESCSACRERGDVVVEFSTETRRILGVLQ